MQSSIRKYTEILVIIIIEFTRSRDYNRFWIVGSCNQVFFFTSEILVIIIILNIQNHAIMIDFDGSLVRQIRSQVIQTLVILFI